MASILDTIKAAAEKAKSTAKNIYETEKKYIPTDDPTTLFYKSLVGAGKYAASFLPKAQTTSTTTTPSGGGGGGGGGGGAGGAGDTSGGGVDKVVKPAAKTGGGGGATGGGASVPTAGDSEVATNENDPYKQAMEATQAQIPLIQQRYQSLLDEIDRAAKESQAAEEKASEGSISEARARSAAAGVFSGSTELGTETNIRERAAAVIRNIQESGASKKAQAVAQEAIDVNSVTKDLANLAIAKDKSDREAAQYAMDYILKSKSLDIQAAQLGKGTVAQTAEGVMLIDPYTGKIISRVGSPKTAASSGQAQITAQLGKDVVEQINKSTIFDKTGLAAYPSYAKLQLLPASGATLNDTDVKYKELQGYFFSLQQAAIRAIQGTRPSDYDAISYAKNVSLSITNTPEANRVAINQLLNLVGGGSSTDTSTASSGTGEWQ